MPSAAGRRRLVQRGGPGQLGDHPGQRERGVDLFQQVALVGRLGRERKQQRRLVRVLEDVGDLGQQQAGRPVDGAAAAGERAVGEAAARVGQQDALGPPFDREAGEAGQVLGDAGLPQRLGDLRLDLRVVDDRMLEQRAGGALGGGLALRSALGET